LHRQLPLELALVEATLNEGSAASNEPQPEQTPATRPEPLNKTVRESPPPARSEGTQPTPKPAAPPRVEGPEEASSPSAPAPEASSSEATADSGGPAPKDWLKDNWGRVLGAIRPRSRSVEALLKSCELAALKDDVVTLGFYHEFHKERVSEEKNRTVVEEALSELVGRPLRVRCALITGDREEKEEQSEAKRRSQLLESPMVKEAIKNHGARVVDVH
jgi:DNA polymerase-3 subunit gamma/tau